MVGCRWRTFPTIHFFVVLELSRSLSFVSKRHISQNSPSSKRLLSHVCLSLFYLCLHMSVSLFSSGTLFTCLSLLFSFFLLSITTFLNSDDVHSFSRLSLSLYAKNPTCPESQSALALAHSSTGKLLASRRKLKRCSVVCAVVCSVVCAVVCSVVCSVACGGVWRVVCCVWWRVVVCRVVSDVVVGCCCCCCCEVCGYLFIVISAVSALN